MTPIIGNFLRYIGVVDASRYNVLALLNSTWTCKRRLDDSPNEYEDVLRYNSIGKILSRKLYFPFIYSLSVAPQTLLYFDKVWGLKLSSIFTCWSIRHDNTQQLTQKLNHFDLDSNVSQILMECFQRCISYTGSLEFSLNLLPLNWLKEMSHPPIMIHRNVWNALEYDRHHNVGISSGGIAEIFRTHISRSVNTESGGSECILLKRRHGICKMALQTGHCMCFSNWDKTLWQALLLLWPSVGGRYNPCPFQAIILVEWSSLNCVNDWTIKHL